MATKEEKVAQSTLLMEQLLRVLPVDKILEFRATAITLHKQQLELVDKILADKGYVEGGIQG
jgi:hypothetical protein